MSPRAFVFFLALCATALQAQTPAPGAERRPDPDSPRSAKPARGPGAESARPRPGRRPAARSETEDGRISPDRAALYGIVPGGGQWYLGQEGTAFLQLGLFLGAEYLYREGARGADYIRPGERRVAFSAERYLVARELDRYGLLYRDRSAPADMGGALLLYEAHRQGLANRYVPNLIGESRTERLGRMAGAGGGGSSAVEINPLVAQNGEYYRNNAATIRTDSFRDLSRWTLFYSIFSADRDARAYADGVEPVDDFAALAASPFQTEFVRDPYVWLPVLATPLLLEMERRGGRRTDPLAEQPYNLLVPVGTFEDPSVQSNMIARSLGNALAEEALFRGVAYRRLSASYGFAAGSLLSGSLYAAYRYGMGNENVWPSFAYSLYWSYLDLRSDSDLRPTVASHFWTNLAIMLYSLSRAQADERANLSNQEIHFMPVFFTFDA